LRAVDGQQHIEIRTSQHVGVGIGWAKWEPVFAESLSRATDALIDMAGIRPGMRVLDLVCGAGSQSIQAAKRVGPNGKVVASDISGTMLEHARRNAARAGLQNIETLECAADELDETQAPFDASICRLGLMLFPSPQEALEAVRRVLKPGAFRGTGLYDIRQQSLYGAIDGDPACSAMLASPLPHPGNPEYSR
jgi:ubiquinone/menaquinone biosynthesis C-methylase UbiE